MTALPLRRALLAALVACIAVPAAATEARPGPIQVSKAMARATVPGQSVGAGYVTLNNTGTTADRLLSVKAAVSKSVELHTMAMDGDVMRMRQVESIEVPAGQVVELKPGGLHIMFMGLKAPLKVGTEFPATLRFAKAGDVKVTVTVQAVAPAPMKH